MEHERIDQRIWVYKGKAGDIIRVEAKTRRASRKALNKYTGNKRGYRDVLAESTSVAGVLKPADVKAEE